MFTYVYTYILYVIYKDVEMFISAFVVYTSIQVEKYFVGGNLRKLQMRDFIIIYSVYLLILKLFKYKEMVKVCFY